MDKCFVGCVFIGIIIVAICVLSFFAFTNTFFPPAVSFDQEGGWGGSKKVEITDEELPDAVAPKRTGYIFKGYFDQKDGNGKQYYSATMEKMSEKDFKRSKELFAYWVTDKEYEAAYEFDFRLKDDKTYELTKVYSIPIIVEIPDSFNEKPVTSIGREAFMFSSVNRVVIPDTVKKIGYRAFYYCSSLTSIIVPDSVSEIGEGAFEGCKKLETIMFPSDLTSLPKNVLKDCLSLNTINLGNDIVSIGEAAFSNCKSLATINLPDTLTAIEKETFKNCTSLTELSLPNNLTSIKRAAFQNCSMLEQMEIPTKVKTIEDYAFSNVSAEISFGQDSEMTVLAKGCFINYGGSSIELPDNIQNIKSLAFANCPNLTSVTLNSSLVSIDKYAFQSCKNLTEISIPVSVVQIDVEAFYLCEQLVISYQQ